MSQANERVPATGDVVIYVVSDMRVGEGAHLPATVVNYSPLFRMATLSVCKKGRDDFKPTAKWLASNPGFNDYVIDSETHAIVRNATYWSRPGGGTFYFPEDVKSAAPDGAKDESEVARECQDAKNAIEALKDENLLLRGDIARERADHAVIICKYDRLQAEYNLLHSRYEADVKKYADKSYQLTQANIGLKKTLDLSANVAADANRHLVEKIKRMEDDNAERDKENARLKVAIDTADAQLLTAVRHATDIISELKRSR